MSAGGVEFSSDGRCLQVKEWVLTGFSRQREQVCSERRPRRLAGEFGDDLVGLAVERLNDLGANQLLGRHMEPFGVALNGLESRAAGSLSPRSSVVAEVGVSSRARICCSSLGRGAGCDGFGSNDGVRVALADDLQVKMVGRSSAGKHRVQLLA